MFPTISTKGSSFTDSSAEKSPRLQPRSTSPLRGNQTKSTTSKRSNEAPGVSSSLNLSCLNNVMGDLDNQLRGMLDERSLMNQMVLQELKDSVAPPSSPSKRDGEGPSGVLWQAAGLLPSSPRPLGRPKSPAFASSKVDRPPSASRMSRDVATPHRWAVAESEGLGWVRSLVKYTEGNPINTMPGAEDAAHPSRREDVGLLQVWLEDAMMKLQQPVNSRSVAQPPSAMQQILKQQGLLPAGGSRSRPGSAKGAGGLGRGDLMEAPFALVSGVDLTDGAIHVYGVAFEELKRQVSTECKERGMMMDTLFDSVISLVQLRTSFAAEEKLENMQQQYVELMDTKDKLQADLQNLKQSVVDSKQEGVAVVAKSKEKEKLVVQKLVATQKAAETMQRDFKVTDEALKNEVERRLEMGEALQTTQMLLAKTEADWLHHRKHNIDLEKKVASLSQALADAVKEVEQSRVARTEAHGLYDTAQHTRAYLELDLARIRHDYKTNEIIVVGLRQQVKELVEQLTSIKGFNRDLAVQMASASEDNERLAFNLKEKEGALEVLSSKQQQLETKFEIATTQLEVTSTQLVQKEAELQVVDARMEDSVEAAEESSKSLKIELKQLNDHLAYTLYKLNVKELQWQELHTELESVKDALQSQITSTLLEQGADGVCKAGEKGWMTTGPLGGVQRTLGTTLKQLVTLGERLEAFRKENTILTQRLESEMDMQRRLQHDLHESRSAEAKMLKEKDGASTRLELSQSLVSQYEAEIARLKKNVADLTLLIGSSNKQLCGLMEQVAHLQPFESKCKKLAMELEDAKRNLMGTEDKLLLSQEENLQLNQSHGWHKDEVEKMVVDHEKMQDELRMLKIVSHEADDLKVENEELRKQLMEGQEKFHQSLESLAVTLSKLEISRQLLSGMGDINSGDYDVSMTLPEPDAYVGGSETLTLSSGMPRSLSPSLSSNWGKPAGGGHFLTASTGRAAVVSPPLLSSIYAPGTPAAAGDGMRPLSGMSMGSKMGPDSVHYEGGSNYIPGGVHRPTAYSSRPMTGQSAMSALTDNSATSGLDPEVFKAMESKGLLQKQQNTAMNWLKLKLKITAYFSNRLREKLTDETERRVKLEIDLAHLEVHLLDQAKRREEFLAVDLLASLQAASTRARVETKEQLSALRSLLPPMHGDLAALARNSTVVCMKLNDYLERDRSKVSKETQTDSELDVVWSSFLQTMPRFPPDQPLSESAVIEAIVRIYIRQASTIVDWPVWGADRVDTVYDGIMGHYNSQRAPTAFSDEWLTNHDSPIGRLLRCCRRYRETTKIAMFCYFVGCTPDAVKWPTSSWHFFLHLLHCLKILLSGSWKSTSQQWASARGAQIPIQAAYDLVGNLFNVQSPKDLEGAVSTKLHAIIIPGQSGSVIDLDALLLLLVNEYNLGNCPRAALLYPRRVTDGKLFNLFNHSGHTPDISAIETAKKENLISSKPSNAWGAKTPKVVDPKQAAAAAKLQEGVKLIWQPSIAREGEDGGLQGSVSQRPGTVPANMQRRESSSSDVGSTRRNATTSHGSRHSQREY